MYVLYDDTRSSIHEMDDDRIMSRTCLRQRSVIITTADNHATVTAVVPAIRQVERSRVTDRTPGYIPIRLPARSRTCSGQNDILFGTQRGHLDKQRAGSPFQRAVLWCVT